MYAKCAVFANDRVGCFSVMIKIVAFSPCRVRDLLLRTSHIHPYTVKSKLKGGNLGSWMATKDASLNAADYVFPIEISTSSYNPRRPGSSGDALSGGEGRCRGCKNGCNIFVTLGGVMLEASPPHPAAVTEATAPGSHWP